MYFDLLIYIPVGISLSEVFRVKIIDQIMKVDT